MFHTPENEHVPLKRGQFQKGAEHHLSSHYFLGNMSNIFRIFVGNMLLFLWPQWRLQCDLKVTESKRQTRDDCSDSQASWAPLDLGSPPSCRWFYDFMNQVVDKSYWMVVTSRSTTLYGYDTILVLWVRTMQPFFFSILCLSCFFGYVYLVGSWNDLFLPNHTLPVMKQRPIGARDTRLATCNGEDLVLCNRTIRENLLYGCDTEPNEADARQALRAAQCEDGWFLERLGVVLGWWCSPFLVRIWCFLFTYTLWFFGFWVMFFFFLRKVPHHFGLMIKSTEN